MGLQLDLVQHARCKALRTAIEDGDLNAVGNAAQSLADALGGRVDFNTVGPGVASLYLLTLLLPMIDED